ncbi:hypothetical protein P5V15_014732 [Pogonomyrmex californicus]
MELLLSRSVKCFRCFARGHTRHHCISSDRAGSCFNCGDFSHKLKDCRNRPDYPLCHEAGRLHEHHAGSEVCPLRPPGPLINLRDRSMNNSGNNNNMRNSENENAMITDNIEEGTINNNNNIIDNGTDNIYILEH